MHTSALRLPSAASLLVAVLVALFTGLTPSVVQAIDLQPVLLQAQVVPGDAPFTFHAPASSLAGLNNNRKVVVWGGWDATDQFSESGSFIWENGVLTDLIRSNDVVNSPGIGQPVIITQPGFLDENGNVAQPAAYGVDQDDVNYIGPNRAGLVYVNGSEAANAPGNAHPWNPFVSVEANNNGHMAFYGRVNNNDLGLWLGTSAATLTRLVQEDTTLIPGTATPIRSVAFETPYVNSSGFAVFDAQYGDDLQNDAKHVLLYGSNDGNLQVIARSDVTEVPGLLDGTKFKEVYKEGFNNNGSILYAGTWGNGNRRGLFTTAPGVFAPVALSGVTQVPDLVGEFFDDFSFSNAIISGNDKIYFEGETSITNIEGVYKWENGTLSTVIREGQNAPGTASTFAQFSSLHTDAEGNLLFLAETVAGDEGLWYLDASSNQVLPQLLVGQLADVLGDGTDLRPIAEIVIAATQGGPQAGENRRLNDNGDFLVRLSFDGGVNTRPVVGLYLAAVIPEPSAAVLVAVACLLGRRQRLR